MAAQTTAASVDEELKSLWALRETFFADDPAAKETYVVKRGAEIAAAVAEQKKGGGGGGADARARAAYARGRALDAAAAYSAEAEADLSRAVKLAPDFVDAWCALGHCFWKKNDLNAARDCYEGARDRQPTPDALRALSVLCRSVPPKSPDDDVHGQSVAHARHAAKLDGSGESWRGGRADGFVALLSFLHGIATSRPRRRRDSSTE